MDNSIDLSIKNLINDLALNYAGNIKSTSNGTFDVSRTDG